ncbi:SIS domain-containing protein [Erwinia sp. CPCC 100877]|nr:SIS domain-containing protein [Erwinia sp. CPCC 100877]
MYFNKSSFIENYEKVAGQFDHVAATAKTLQEKAYKKIFLLGSGGAYTKYVDLRPLLFKKLNVPFLITSPEELVSQYLDEINEETLIVVGTKTGTTKELLAALTTVRERCAKVTVLGFVGDDDTEIDHLHLLDYRISSVDTDVHLVLFGWFILNYAGTSTPTVKAELLDLGGKIGQTLAGLEEQAKEAVYAMDLERMQMWVASGHAWGEVCCYCNYILEEIQWIQAQGIHSSEFFHGPFELVVDNFQVNVVLNTDGNRQQDLRVAEFVKKHTSAYTIIDMQDFDLESLSSEVKEFIEPYVLNHYFDLLLRIYMKRTGKSAQTRRYYRKMEY